MNSVSFTGNPNIIKRVYNKIPNKVISSDKLLGCIEKFGQKCTSAHQRGILGLTALMTQPFIDARNKDVDEKTKKYSVARTIAKIIAGTMTGVAIRAGCIRLMKTKFFHPARWDKLAPDIQDQYRNGMGTFLSLFIMVFTNFLIDAPLTKFLTGRFVKHADKVEARKKSKEVQQ